jgi:pimeloyl-ACP methyl ester carboxylesterase
MYETLLLGILPQTSRLKLRPPTRFVLLSFLAVFGLIILWKFSDISHKWHPTTESHIGPETQHEIQPEIPSVIQPEIRPETVKYSGEHIYWEPCGDLKGDKLECSSIDVPIDQFAKVSRPEHDLKFTIPLIRLRGANATQNLLLNPGGPGASGINMLYNRGAQLRTIVGEGFHLLSFDPRGVNSSTPAASCYPDAETRQRLSDLQIVNPIAEASTIYAWVKNFVRACPDTMGYYARYINTPQTAADMNSILDALGQRDMIYWGFSYGSLLGQTYAGLFPERSKRVIIDGVINQFKWYDGVFEIESGVDVKKVLDGFFEECLKSDSYTCPLLELTSSKDPIMLGNYVRSHLDPLKDQPLNVYVNSSTYGLLTYEKLWDNGVLQALLKPSRWSVLASTLYALIRGDPKDAFKRFGIKEARKDESNEFVILNDGPSGPGHSWPPGRDDLMDWIFPYIHNNSLTAGHIPLFFAKQQWKIPQTHSYVPRRGVETSHPLLILSTTYDPSTPLVSAISANEAFAGSQIIEVEGYGHCSIAVASVCAVKHVRAFLYEGTLPSDYTKCPVDGPFFMRPDKHMKMSTQVDFKDPEDRKIHAAQLELMTGCEVL